MLLYSVQDTGFFWDTIQLASKHAHFFFENDLKWEVLPQDIDSGHPPIFGYILACFWTFFGKSLWISHWMMLPILCGIIWQLTLIARKLAGEKWAFWLLPLVLFDPVLSGQMALVSPDIALVFFFLLSLNGILKGENVPSEKFSPFGLSLGIIGLCLISTRGMMTAAVLFLFTILNTFFLKKETCLHRIPAVTYLKKIVNIGLPFLPGALMGVSFLYWHYLQVGWIGFHEDMPWAPAFEAVNLRGLIRNMAIIGWRWLDFNRFVIFAFGIWIYFKTKTINLSKQELLLLGLMLMLLSISALLYKNLSAHRYFLPSMLWVNILLFTWVTRSAFSDYWKKTILVSITILLALGNFWKNPEGISMDWDSTLAHVHFTDALQDMRNQIGQSIDYQSIGTDFPVLNTGENLFLNRDERIFVGKDLKKNAFVLYSNVSNDFSNEEITELKNHWEKRISVKHGYIDMTLYARPKSED